MNADGFGAESAIAGACDGASTGPRPDDECDVFTEAELAARLRVDRTTLRQWSRDGLGPPRIQIGPRAVRYRRSSVVAWLDSLQPEARPA